MSRLLPVNSLVAFIVIMALNGLSVDAKDSILAGVNLMCCCNEYPGLMKAVRNATGHVMSKVGLSVEMMDWMSSRFRLDGYECAPLIGTTTVDNTSTAIGNVFRVKSGICEVNDGPVVLLHHRLQYIDFLLPWMIEPVVLLIPAPVSSTNLAAVWKPFGAYVWFILTVAVVLVTATLIVTSRFDENDKRGMSSRDFHWLMLVTGLLLSKAGIKSPTNFKMRLATGAWCVALVVLINYYCSILFAFIMAPSFRPLVDSVQELAFTEDVGLVVVKNYAVDISISGSADPTRKKLAKKLNRNESNSRRTNVSQCIDDVKKGRNVLIHQYGPVLFGMADDFRQTGSCNLALAKGIFDSYPAAWMVPKKHPYSESLNRGILRMLETGLIATWMERYQPKLKQCLKSVHHSITPKTLIEEARHVIALTLGNLAGAFLVLLGGLALSVVAFILERIIELSTR